MPLTEQTGLVIIWISFSLLVVFSEPDSLCSQDLSGKYVEPGLTIQKVKKKASGEQKEKEVTDSQDLSIYTGFGIQGHSCVVLDQW